MPEVHKFSDTVIKMNKEIQKLKNIEGYMELRITDDMAQLLKSGFKYYYDGNYGVMKRSRSIEWNATAHMLTGFSRFNRRYFKGRVEKILWPSCNTDQPVIFFLSKTLEHV